MDDETMNCQRQIATAAAPRAGSNASPSVYATACSCDPAAAACCCCCRYMSLSYSTTPSKLTRPSNPCALSEAFLLFAASASSISNT